MKRTILTDAHEIQTHRTQRESPSEPYLKEQTLPSTTHAEMKLAISTLVLALLACLALAVEQPKEQVIISYPKNTPNSVLEEAKKAIVQAVSP